MAGTKHLGGQENRTGLLFKRYYGEEPLTAAKTIRQPPPLEVSACRFPKPISKGAVSWSGRSRRFGFVWENNASVSQTVCGLQTPAQRRSRNQTIQKSITDTMPTRCTNPANDQHGGLWEQASPRAARASAYCSRRFVLYALPL